MAAYFIGSIKSHEDSWVEEYNAEVPALLGKHGGELVCRSEKFVRYEGEGEDPDLVIIVKFPSMEAIDAFMSDPEYAPHLASRIACTDSDIVAIS
ncbi:MAG: DUF1330 domain-containing protein [Alteraurantiacibacter sp. bin_em_oilr2.035]|nr:DUF1330 domain-containing protein [Alteraurantiacibacter sp. bin_em_oilr2.035]